MSRDFDIEYNLRGRHQGVEGATLQGAVHTRRQVNAGSTFKTDPCRALAAWWKGSSDNTVPCRCAFDITEHPQLAPYLFLVDIPEPGAYRFRLMGEMAKTVVGVNSTGLVLRRAEVRGQNAMLVDYYEQIITTRQPWSCEGNLAGYEGFESIDCPLTVPGTDAIGGLIGAIAVIKKTV